MSHGTEYVVLPCTKTDQLLRIFAAWMQPSMVKNNNKKKGVNFSLFDSQSVSSQACSNFLLSQMCFKCDYSKVVLITNYVITELLTAFD